MSAVMISIDRFEARMDRLPTHEQTETLFGGLMTCQLPIYPRGHDSGS